MGYSRRGCARLVFVGGARSGAVERDVVTLKWNLGREIWTRAVVIRAWRAVQGGGLAGGARVMYVCMSLCPVRASVMRTLARSTDRPTDRVARDRYRTRWESTRSENRSEKEARDVCGWMTRCAECRPPLVGRAFVRCERGERGCMYSVGVFESVCPAAGRGRCIGTWATQRGQ